MFFCNSGTEAWEASLKFCRKWGNTTHDQPKNRLIAFENSFHGRTYGSISTTGQPKYHKGFEPLLPGIDFARFNDLASVESLVTDQTCAILVEPVQAEGGIHAATGEFLSGLRHLCDEREMLLVFDEIQVGCGRLGSLWGYQQYEVEPDIMTLAKAPRRRLADRRRAVAAERSPMPSRLATTPRRLGPTPWPAPRRPRSWASCWSRVLSTGCAKKANT